MYRLSSQRHGLVLDLDDGWTRCSWWSLPTKIILWFNDLPTALQLHSTSGGTQNPPHLQGKSAPASLLVLDQEGIQCKMLFKNCKPSKRQKLLMNVHIVFQTGRLVSQMQCSSFLTTQETHERTVFRYNALFCTDFTKHAKCLLMQLVHASLGCQWLP